MSTEAADILIRVEGRAGRLTLNRPKALNALTHPQVTKIAAALAAWEADPKVEVVVLDGAGDRGLCAGGDVRVMHESRTGGSGFARTFWADEYRLNARIARYPKPFVALMDGIVMGGGIGVSAHARHRVVTERSQLAMPETAIGLIPDVGGTWLLAHAPGELGVYLGLTGKRMSGADAIQIGFADHHMVSANLGRLVERLCAPSADLPIEIIEDMEQPVPMSELMAKSREITRLFLGGTIDEIFDQLKTSADALALETRAELAGKSPTSLKLTLRAIREARKLPSLEAALEIEYRLTTRLFESGEFIEGIRALIVDKDKAPKWTKPTLDSVTEQVVEGYFAPLSAAGTLTFPGKG
jgi:enoyl-CoA hydratase